MKNVKECLSVTLIKNRDQIDIGYLKYLYGRNIDKYTDYKNEKKLKNFYLSSLSLKIFFISYLFVIVFCFIVSLLFLLAQGVFGGVCYSFPGWVLPWMGLMDGAKAADAAGKCGYPAAFLLSIFTWGVWITWRIFRSLFENSIINTSEGKYSADFRVLMASMLFVSCSALFFCFLFFDNSGRDIFSPSYKDNLYAFFIKKYIYMSIAYISLGSFVFLFSLWCRTKIDRKNRGGESG